MVTFNPDADLANARQALSQPGVEKVDLVPGP
jgi:hypothetical protein